MRLLLILTVTMLTLSACNTVAGVGQDMQNAGHALKKAAD